MHDPIQRREDTYILNVALSLTETLVTIIVVTGLQLQ